MADTVRQHIIDNLKTRFAAMTTAGGYTLNSPQVYDWRLIPLEDADLPAIEIEDGTDSHDASKIIIADHVIELTISIVVQNDTAPADLRAYIADIYTCIGTDPTCGGYAEDMIPVKDEILLDQKDKVRGEIRTVWKVPYITDRWNLTKNYS